MSRRFSFDPGHPNRLEPGKTPLHTLIASIAFRDDRLWSVAGCMGADGRPQIHLQTYVNLIDFDRWRDWNELAGHAHGIVIVIVMTSNFNLPLSGQTFAFTGLGNPENTKFYLNTLTVTPIPEPETYVLLMAGLGMLGALARRRNKKTY